MKLDALSDIEPYSIRPLEEVYRNVEKFTTKI